MFIPKQFELLSQTIKVEEVENLGLEAGAIGRCYFDQNLIKIQKHNKAYPLPKDQRMKTYYHELAHMIMHSMQRHELRDDEAFIDMLGDLLWQHEKSKVK